MTPDQFLVVYGAGAVLFFWILWIVTGEIDEDLIVETILWPLSLAVGTARRFHEIKRRRRMKRVRSSRIAERNALSPARTAERDGNR